MMETPMPHVPILTRPDIGTPLFKLEGVGLSVSGRDLLVPLTTAVSRRGVTGLIGQNGSGKSTLMKILARQQGPSVGRVVFDGKPQDEWGNRDYARKVAYLPQTLPPAPNVLVRELVSLGRYPWHGPLGRFSETDRHNVQEALALTGIEALADRLVDTLSGGERQRAWLAMLIAQDAGAILLDEPISALDIVHQVEVLSLTRRLSVERNTTVVVVLHDINMTAQFCDNIIALHDGDVIAQGDTSTIMNSATLKDIYGLHMQIVTHPHTHRALAFP